MSVRSKCFLNAVLADETIITNAIVFTTALMALGTTALTTHPYPHTSTHHTR